MGTKQRRRKKSEMQLVRESRRRMEVGGIGEKRALLGVFSVIQGFKIS